MPTPPSQTGLWRCRCSIRPIRLLPAQQPHSAGEGCQHRKQQPERMPCAWDRQFRDELHDGDRRGEQPQRSALPSEESPLVGEGEPVVGLALACGVRGGLAVAPGGVISHGTPRRACRRQAFRRPREFAGRAACCVVSDRVA